MSEKDIVTYIWAEISFENFIAVLCWSLFTCGIADHFFNKQNVKRFETVAAESSCKYALGVRCTYEYFSADVFRLSKERRILSER